MNTIVMTGIAGCAGVLARVWIDMSSGISAPTTTLIINCVGSLAAAVIATLAAGNNLITQETKLIFVSGFCGGLTTFSALSIQSLGLLTGGEVIRGLAYLLGSPILGVASAFLGLRLATLFSS